MSYTSTQPDTGTERLLRSTDNQSSGPSAAEEHCIFECNGHVFAVGLNAVREVLSGKLATPIPQAPPALVGVVELHGDVLPVVQLGMLLGMPTRPYTPANPIVVLSSHATKIGVVVDRVRPVQTIAPALLSSTTHDLYRGWYAGTVPRAAVLNVNALVTHALRTVATHLHDSGAGTASRTLRTDGANSLSSS